MAHVKLPPRPSANRVIEIPSCDGPPWSLASGPVSPSTRHAHCTDDAWNKGNHGKSGLTDKVRASTISEAEAEQQVLEFVMRYVPKHATPMCGNTIGQDRRFLVKYMPTLEAWFHYRNLDVSTLKELARRWRPEVHSSFRKRQLHTALADVHESIANRSLPRALPEAGLTALDAGKPETCHNRRLAA